MRILVIGGNRFVGKALAKKIVWEYRYNFVDVFNRSGTGPWGTNIIQGDRNNRKDLDKIDWDKYDTIVDMCLFKIEQFELIKNHIPIHTNYIFVSSGAVDYIDTNSFGDYAVEKMDIEKALLKSSLNYKIIRPSYIVGMGNHRPRLGYYISQLKNNEPITIDGDGNYPINLVFAKDVVDCLIKLIVDDKRTYETYNICSDESITINSLIEFLKQELDIENHEIINTVDSLFPNQSFEFDNTKIKDDYNVNFTDLKQGIIKYIGEYNEL